MSFEHVLKAHWLSWKMLVLDIFVRLQSFPLLHALKVAVVNTSYLVKFRKVSKCTDNLREE